MRHVSVYYNKTVVNGVNEANISSWFCVFGWLWNVNVTRSVSLNEQFTIMNQVCDRHHIFAEHSTWTRAQLWSSDFVSRSCGSCLKYRIDLNSLFSKRGLVQVSQSVPAARAAPGASWFTGDRLPGDRLPVTGSPVTAGGSETTRHQHAEEEESVPVTLRRRVPGRLDPHRLKDTQLSC